MKEAKQVNKLYLISVLLFMLILPVIFISKELTSGDGRYDLIAASGKWFVFWGVGLRLITAGMRQVMKPEFTTKEIFHLNDMRAAVIVKELGLANICFGLTAMISLFIPGWRPAAAFAGGLYFGLAGVQHIIKKPVSENEIIAMVSDIFITIVLAGYLIGTEIS